MAQRTETNLKDLTDLLKGLDSKIEGLGKKIEDIDKKVEDLDRKMERGFVEVDKKIEALDKKIDLGFQGLDGKIDKLDIRLGILETSVTKLDTRLWAFSGIALTATLGSLLTVFARYLFTDSPKF